MLFSYGYGRQQIGDNKKCRQIAGDFDHHDVDGAVWCGAYCLMEHIPDSTSYGVQKLVLVPSYISYT